MPNVNDEATRRRTRPVRSYVLREGRLTAGQQRAFETLWPRWGVAFEPATMDFDTAFGNHNPVYFEIGFGNGESLAQMAAEHPDRNFIGAEVHRPGVGHLLLLLERYGLNNVRVIRHDALEVLEQMIPDHALDGIYLFFPDPWHKKRHHKRRILQTRLLDEAARVLRPGGLFHAATDWQDYANHMLTTLDGDQRFVNDAGPGAYSERPKDRPLTKFERRGHRLGHGVWDLRYELRS